MPANLVLAEINYMKRINLSLLIIISLNATAQNSTTDFKKLCLIRGTWSMETKRGILYEHWYDKDDSTLLGKSYKLNGSDTILLEEVQLIRKGVSIFYIPIVRSPNNEQPVVFTLVKTDNETYIFDNPEHDFPQRVIYQLPKNEQLHAWIEGMDKGVYRKSDFFYKKMK